MTEKEVEVKTPVLNVPPPGEIIFNLDENNELIKPIQKKPEEPRYVRLEDLEILRKSQNYTSTALRKIEEKLDRLTSIPQSPQVPPKPPTEWDEKVQKDWKGTVEELAEIKFQEIMKKKEDEIRSQEEWRRNTALLEDNKKKVLERHKDLVDETSQKAKVYQEVINNHPEYLSNPFGPVLAMRDMEDQLRESGVLDEPTQKVIEKEISRQARASASIIPSASRGVSNKVVLSKDDREYCDHNGIKYETYARMKQMTNQNGGVEAK